MNCENCYLYAQPLSEPVCKHIYIYKCGHNVSDNLTLMRLRQSPGRPLANIPN